MEIKVGDNLRYDLVDFCFNPVVWGASSSAILFIKVVRHILFPILILSERIRQWQ